MENQNPPTIIGAPQPGPTMQEREHWAAENGALEGLRIDTGYYYDYKSPGDKRDERSGGRER